MATNKALQKETSSCKMKSKNGFCPRPIEQASEFLSKKWTMSIVITIGNFESLRFNHLLDRIDRLTAKTLTLRLKELDKEGVILRTACNETPPRVEYSLTPKGKSLLRSLHPLIQWAEKRDQ